MARSYTSQFEGRMLEAHQRPYFILEVAFDGSTKYFIDRETGTFESSGTRHPSVEDALVVDWGSISTALREDRAGGVDQFTIKIEDRDGDLSTIFGASHQQRKAVKVYRLFDETDTVWPTHAAVVFQGSTRPHSYSETDNVISVEVEDDARRLLKKIELRATPDIFPDVKDDYRDRNIPQCWGYSERVEAICVDAPWEIRTLGPASPASDEDMEIALEGHPDEVGAPINEEIEIECIADVAGSGQVIRRVVGKFLLSDDKSTKPSVFRITDLRDNCEKRQFIVQSVIDRTTTGTGKALIYDNANGDLDFLRSSGQTYSVAIRTSSGRFYCAQATLADVSLSYGPGANLVTWSQTTANALRDNLAAGQALTVFYMFPTCAIDSFVTAYLDEDSNRLYKEFLLAVDDFLPEGIVQETNGSAASTNLGAPWAFIGSEFKSLNETFIHSVVTRINDSTFKLIVDVAADVGEPPDPDLVEGLSRFNALAADSVIRFTGMGLGADPHVLRLRPVDYPWVYVANALPSRKVVKVEGRGHRLSSANLNVAGGEEFVVIGETEEPPDGDGIVQITSTAWTADLTDDTWRTELGNNRDLTTITFAREPRRYSAQLKDNRIWVTLQGTDTPLYGYADKLHSIILTYLRHDSLFNVPDDRIDVATIEGLVNDPDFGVRKLGFAQIEPKDGLEYLQDICRQCRAVFFMDQGRFTIRKLYNNPIGYVASFDQDSILDQSLTREESDVDDIVTRLACNWRSSWDEFTKPKKRLAVNPGSEAEFPVASRTVEFFVYRDPDYVDDELAFQLERLSCVYWNIAFQTFGRALVLQPGDWIRLGYTDGTGREIVPSTTYCEVQSVRDKTDGSFEVKVRYPKFTY